MNFYSDIAIRNYPVELNEANDDYFVVFLRQFNNPWKKIFKPIFYDHNEVDDLILAA